MTKSTCIIEECESPSRSRKMCRKHYLRWMRKGSTESVWDDSPITRVMRQVVKDQGCWLWTGNKHSNGYGTFSLEGKPTYVHRFSYEHHNGPIRAGMYVDHVCHNRHCLNPDHLRLATPGDNNAYRKGPQVNNTSGYRGVYRHNPSGLWEATVGHKGVKHRAGYYKTPEEADVAVRALRAKLHKFPEYTEAVNDDSKVLLD